MKLIKFPIITLLFCALALTTCWGQEWETLFDGSSVAAWRGFKRADFPVNGWSLEHGTLKTIVGGDKIDIITKKQYRNFELELEWRIAPSGNSGIFYHVSEELDAVWHSAPEMQVLDDSLHKDGQRAVTSAGSLYDLIAPTNKILMPVGEFNKVRLLVNNNHVEHWLNDVKIVEFNLGSTELDSLIAHSKFKDKPLFAKTGKGHIALQHHGEEVWYRNIRIRTLPN